MSTHQGAGRRTGERHGGPPPPDDPRTALCRDCHRLGDLRGPRCSHCGSPRLVAHAELTALTIAHFDCDAFYATVEKRDNPSLQMRPVIIGGGRRGVVSAACYIARTFGVRSAMPMFKALDLCPSAIVIRPDMQKYRDVGRAVRAVLQQATPLVEPLSIDEAFLDLNGTQALHGCSAAQTCSTIAQRIEREIGITVSIGLSYNKFLAKVASDLDKPRGFAVIGREDAPTFLAAQPVSLLWGVGAALRDRLASDGIRTVGQLCRYEEKILLQRYGSIGRRLYLFSRGIDTRTVSPDAPMKSISSETTFDNDLRSADDLSHRIWPLCETVARRMKREGVGARTVTLKLKTSGFRSLTRQIRLVDATQLAETLYRSVQPVIHEIADGTAYRLIGVGASDFSAAELADPPDLLDKEAERRKRIESAIDAVRRRLGDHAIVKGRALDARAPGRTVSDKRPGKDAPGG